MIIRIEELQRICSKILPAVDSNEISALSTSLEIVCADKKLYINVTNKEYYVRATLDLDEDMDFHATVDAHLFLKLISQITTDTVELSIADNILSIHGNGSYSLPLIYDNDKLLELPEIALNNISSSFPIDSAILKSIATFNSKELLKGTAAQPVQKLYYVDEQGAITFTSGACVNNFTLQQPIKLFFNSRLVKLFKLFDEGAIVMTLGFEPISDDIMQTRIRFESSSISITSILPSDASLFSSIPVTAIRNRANVDNYPFCATVDKNLLIQALNRLALFNNQSLKPYITFNMSADEMVIISTNNANIEKLYYNNKIPALQDTVNFQIDYTDLLSTLSDCSESHLNLHFGDDSAILICRQNVANIIPLCETI